MGSPSKVLCPHCGQAVSVTRHCEHCGKPLMESGKPYSLSNGLVVTPPVSPSDPAVLRTILERVARTMDQLKSIDVARVTYHTVAGDGTCATLRNLVVQTGWRAVVNGGSFSASLEPGSYNLSMRGAQSRGLQAIMARLSADRLSYLSVCQVPQQLLVPFVLPDPAALSEKAQGQDGGGTKFITPEAVQPVLRTLNLATADAYVGAVTTELQLAVTDPVKFQLALLAGDRELERSAQEAHKSVTDRFTLRQRVKAALWGKAGEAQRLPVSYTGLDLLARVRQEFAQVVRGAIADIPIDVLYTSAHQREQVADTVKKGMFDTLSVLGVAVEQLSAFTFYSPDYDRVLDHEQRVKLDRILRQREDEEAELAQMRRKKAAEEVKERLQSTASVQIEEVKTNGEVELTRISTDGLVQEQRFKNEAALSDFKLDEERKRLEGELQGKALKAKAELAIRNEQRNASLDNARRMVELRELRELGEVKRRMLEDGARHKRELAAQQQLFDYRVQMLELVKGEPPEVKGMLLASLMPEAAPAMKLLFESRSKDEVVQLLKTHTKDVRDHSTNERGDFIKVIQSLADASRAQIITNPGSANPMIFGAFSQPNLPSGSQTSRPDSRKSQDDHDSTDS